MHALFSGKCFAAFLFDMDGTLLSSLIAAERVWSTWAAQHGLDVEKFLPTIHGVRSVDTIRRLRMPGIDPEVEAEAITRAEIVDVRGVTPIGGAGAFVRSLPSHRWAIVTSAPLALALARLKEAGLTAPEVMIAAEDVKRGKPDPEGYVLAAGRLGVAVRDCLIFEDASAGIEAAERASAAVMVITQTHSRVLKTAHPSSPNYESLGVDVNASGTLALVRT